MIAEKMHFPTENLRLPPHNLEAEQSVIGSILILDKGDQAIREVFDILRPEMFYSRAHQLIYKAFQTIGAMNEIDMITVSELLESTEELDEAGGFVYLGEVSKNTPSVANVIAYAEIVADRYRQREFLSIVHNASDQIYNKESLADVISCLNRNVEQIDTGGAYEPENLFDAVPDFVDTMQRRADGDIEEIGVKTGIKGIDSQIGGIKKNWLVSLVGRPSMKKTIIAQLINANISRILPTLFFSMEMDREELRDRYIGLMAGINKNNLRDGLLSEYESSRIGRLYQEYHQQMKNVMFDTDPQLSYQQISHRVKRTIKKYGKLGLVTIDYLGIMRQPKADRHDLGIAEITRNLKQLAKETSTPILLLVQANRETDKLNRGTNANIADGAAIERDSDLVIWTHCEEVKDPKTRLKGITEIYGTKGRHSALSHSVYLKQADDIEGGQFYCMSTEEIARIHNEMEADEREAQKPRRSMSEKYGGKK